MDRIYMKEKILKGGGVGGAVGTDLAHSRVQLRY